MLLGYISSHVPEFLTVLVVSVASCLRHDCPPDCRSIHCPEGLGRNIPLRRLIALGSNLTWVPVVPC